MPILLMFVCSSDTLFHEPFLLDQIEQQVEMSAHEGGRH